jgi:hypothetical protein
MIRNHSGTAPEPFRPSRARVIGREGKGREGKGVLSRHLRALALALALTNVMRQRKELTLD